MVAACIMGLRYYAIIFGLAFIMGIARTFVVAPRLGAPTAVLLEVPIIVVVSWAVARSLLRPHVFTLPQRAAMGATAFMLTMVSEVFLAEILRGQSVIGWATAVLTPLGLIGLAGQIAFAIVPIVVARHRGPPLLNA
jgi:hypothetical protein